MVGLAVDRAYSTLHLRSPAQSSGWLGPFLAGSWALAALVAAPQLALYSTVQPFPPPRIAYRPAASVQGHGRGRAGWMQTRTGSSA